MGRITWEYQNSNGSWLGKVGSRTAFLVKPSPGNTAWDIVFNWTGVTFGSFPNIASTREPCEHKLIIFAEQTGLTLPEPVEEEDSLAEELTHRIQGEMRWFKSSDTDAQRVHYVATQVLGFFAAWVQEHLEEVDRVGDDIEYRAAQSKLAEMHEQLQTALVDLGVEVEREVK